MANNPKAKDNIEPYMYQKGQSGNYKGRPPKLLTAVLNDLKEQGYKQVTRGQIIEAYQLLIGLPEDKLKSMILDKAQPILIRVVASNILSNKNGFDVIEKILDRVQGKPTQSIEASGDLTVALVKFIGEDNDEPNRKTGK